MSRVFIPIPISGIEEEKEQPSLTYKLDLDTGRIVGKVDGLEAVNQFILKALLTPRFHCLVYDNQYGSEIKDTVTDESSLSGRKSRDLWRTHSSATAGFSKSMTLSLSSTRIPATSTSRRTLFTGPQRSRR